MDIRIYKKGEIFPEDIAEYDGIATIGTDIEIIKTKKGHSIYPLNKMQENEYIVRLENSGLFSAINGVTSFYSEPRILKPKPISEVL